MGVICSVQASLACCVTPAHMSCFVVKLRTVLRLPKRSAINSYCTRIDFISFLIESKQRLMGFFCFFRTCCFISTSTGVINLLEFAGFYEFPLFYYVLCKIRQQYLIVGYFGGIKYAGLVVLRKKKELNKRSGSFILKESFSIFFQTGNSFHKKILQQST